MRLELLAAELAICRLGPGEEVPTWASGGGPQAASGGALLATVRTGEELSVICAAASVPDGVRADRGWRAFRVAGTLDLELTGVLVRILEPLAAAGIPIFAVSSFDTDYVLVPGDRLERAAVALAAAGFEL